LPQHRARDTIRESIRVQQAMLRDPQMIRMIQDVAAEFARALAKGRKILLFGNGGSAADAQHIAAEFTGRYMMERAPLPAIALTTDSSALTAIGNDYAFEDIFARPLEALGRAGDIAVGFSTSGKSPNVLKALAAARRKKMVTVGFTGRNGRTLAEQSDYCFCVPSTVTPRIQECHTLIAHILCDISENALAARRATSKGRS
jgi:D-sedoheptulose 7-phosphate isomerase